MEIYINRKKWRIKAFINPSYYILYFFVFLFTKKEFKKENETKDLKVGLLARTQKGESVGRVAKAEGRDRAGSFP